MYINGKIETNLFQNFNILLKNPFFLGKMLCNIFSSIQFLIKTKSRFKKFSHEIDKGITWYFSNLGGVLPHLLLLLYNVQRQK